MINHDQETKENEVKSEMTDTETTVETTEVTEATVEVTVPETQEESTTQETASEEEIAPDETCIETKVDEPIAEAKPEPQPVKVKKAAPTINLDDLTPEEKANHEMMQLIDESFSNRKKGQIVKGVVVGVTDKEVMVDIGFKSEGVIPIAEFAYSGIPERNSELNVYISETEDGEGKIHLSKKRADFILNIQLMKQAFENGTNVAGIIRRRVKGGMIVDMSGIEGFLPGSQMSLKPIPNLDQFIGKELTYKIVSLDEERRNIILSRKKVLEEEMSVKKHDLLDKIAVGAELEGEVKNITQYGAFVDLGGIDGLLHLSDMSWGKINHPSEMLNMGDKLKVKVTGYDAESNRISLGLKQLIPHPWEHIEIKYPEGTRVTGKAVSVKSYGAFIEIEPGVEGLVHISEMSWTKKIADARRILKNGDTVNAIVLELDKENKRISLGMKQMEANPWLSIEDRYPMGTVLTRKIKSLTTFGAFVEIEEGIDGLIHISDISWTKRIYHPREIFRKNQEVEAIVLTIDRALHRVALGVKQLKPDPWETLPQVLPVNIEVKGKISKLIPKGILVDIMMGEDIVEGFVPISHLAIPKLEHSEDAFHVGEELPLKVIELDTDNRRLILSAKAFFFSRDPKLQEEYIALHEQYMRDRVARLIKKKAEKDTKQKERELSGETDIIDDDDDMDNNDFSDIDDEVSSEETPEVAETPVDEPEAIPAIEAAPEVAEIEETPAEEVAQVEAEVITAPVEEMEAMPAEETISEPEITEEPETKPE